MKISANERTNFKSSSSRRVIFLEITSRKKRAKKQRESARIKN